jgi:hypothetical protein
MLCVRRRGSASRKATLKARAPAEDTLTDHLQRHKSKRDKSTAYIYEHDGRRNPQEIHRVL